MHAYLPVKLLCLAKSTESFTVGRIRYDSASSSICRNCSCILTEHLDYICYSCKLCIFFCESYCGRINIGGECLEIGSSFYVKCLLASLTPYFFINKSEILSCEPSVTSRGNVFHYHCCLYCNCSTATHGIPQKYVFSRTGGCCNCCCKGFSYRCTERILTVTSLVKSDSRGVYHQSGYIVQDKELYLVFNSCFGELIYTVDL